MPAPSLSVLVTTCNHAPFVEEALESLRVQTRQDFEVLITDDASSDETPDIIARWLSRTNAPFRFIANTTTRGICANRNSALALTGAPFVSSLSGDDAYEPDRVERQLALLQEQPHDVAAVYGDMRVVLADGSDTGTSYLQSKFGDVPPPEDAEVFPALLRNNWMPTPAVMVRRSALSVVGPYDEELINEDYDMWLRLSHRFRFRHLPRVVMRYRLLSNSLSHAPKNEDALVQSRGRVLARWLGRSGVSNDRVIIERLWGIGRQQLRRGFDAEAQRNLSVASAADAHLKRRFVSGLAGWNLGRRALRASGRL